MNGRLPLTVVVHVYDRGRGRGGEMGDILSHPSGLQSIISSANSDKEVAQPHRLVRIQRPFAISVGSCKGRC